MTETLSEEIKLDQMKLTEIITHKLKIQYFLPFIFEGISNF